MPNFDRLTAPDFVVQQYRKGLLTKDEMMFTLMQRLTAENVAAFVSRMSRSFLDELEQEVQTYPTTEDGWAGLMWIHGAVYRAGMTAEQIRDFEAERNHQFRRGVTALRAYFAARREEG